MINIRMRYWLHKRNNASVEIKNYVGINKCGFSIHQVAGRLPGLLERLIMAKVPYGVVDGEIVMIPDTDMVLGYRRRTMQFNPAAMG